MDNVPFRIDRHRQSAEAAVRSAALALLERQLITRQCEDATNRGGRGRIRKRRHVAVIARREMRIDLQRQRTRVGESDHIIDLVFVDRRQRHLQHGTQTTFAQTIDAGEHGVE